MAETLNNWKDKSKGCRTKAGITYHPYKQKTCTKCATRFCYACCHTTNYDDADKQEPTWMLCPNPECGYDWYDEGR